MADTVCADTLFELDPVAPFDGYKPADAGRVLGAEPPDAFLQTKTVVPRYRCGVE